jgi:drug/metabolite transporter (DMT)-like permease
VTGVLGISRVHFGCLQVFAAAVMWGTYGLFVRSLSYPPEYILFSRYFFGLIGLLVFTSVKDGFAWVKPSMPHWKWMILPAALTGLSWLAYTYALQHTFVANAAFLAYTAPVFTLILAPFILKEKLESGSIIALLLSLSGTLAIMGYNSLFFAGATLKGDLYALSAGVLGGLTISFIKKIPAEISGYKVNIVMSTFIAMILFPLALRADGQISLKSLPLMLAMGILLQAIATTLFYTGLRSIKAQHSAILTYADPLAATVMAALFLAESITLGSLLGGAFIIASGTIIVLNNRVSPALEKVKLEQAG